MAFVGTDTKHRFFGLKIDVFKMKIGELTDADTCLEKDLDNSRDTNVSASGIAESAVLKLTKDTRRGSIELGMSQQGSWIIGDELVDLEETEESLSRVGLARDRFGSVALFRKGSHEGF